MGSNEKQVRRYLPHIIYTNLQKFLKYRKLDLVLGSIYSETKKTSKETSQFMDQDEFIKSIQYYGYILVEAKDNPEKNRKFHKSVHPANRKRPVKTYILLLDIESVHTESSHNLEKVINKIPGFDKKGKDYNLDIIIITHHELNPHLTKKIESIIDEGDNENGYIHIYAYRYVHFTSERPKHKLVAPQRIISKEEEKEILENLFTSKKHLPKMKKNDPIAIWLGAEIGDIVEALIPSESSGIETKYLVIRP